MYDTTIKPNKTRQPSNHHTWRKIYPAKKRPMTCKNILAKLIFHESVTQDSFNGPSRFYSIVQCTRLYTYRFCPIVETFSGTPKLNKSGISSISILFSCCNPSTIFFTIVSVHINSIYLGLSNARMSLPVACVGFIHIVSKFLKRIPKALYPTTSIDVPSVVFGVLTSRPHCHVGIVKWTYLTSFTKAMFFTKSLIFAHRILRLTARRIECSVPQGVSMLVMA